MLRSTALRARTSLSACVMARPIGVSPLAMTAGGSKSAAVVSGCSNCTGLKVTTANSTRLLASVSAARFSRGDCSPRVSSLIGVPAIALDTSSSNTHWQRGSGLLAKSLVSKEVCAAARAVMRRLLARWMRSGPTRQAARCVGARRDTGFLGKTPFLLGETAERRRMSCNEAESRRPGQGRDPSQGKEIGPRPAPGRRRGDPAQWSPNVQNHSAHQAKQGLDQRLH